MKVLFTGDLFLGGDLLYKKPGNPIKSSTFNDADIRIINLEQPISDNKEVEDKCTLYTGSSAIQRLREMNIQAVNLANNHIQDKTDIGIIETIEHLNNSGIAHFGAGRNLNEAKQPYWIEDKLCVLSYCEFGRRYLKQIRLATDSEPGVNPLRYEEIMHDLDRLPEDIQAILFFHWGREHVCIPPYNNIKLAKKLLEDKRVALIIGMHAHRIQGYIEHNGKRAYMCLGNFLFPNFFIKSPTQICYPDGIPTQYDVTRQYLAVYRLTYKKWRLVNRISLIIELDTNKDNLKPVPVIQDDNHPQVKEVNYILKIFIIGWLYLLSIVYRLPAPIYKLLEKVNIFFVYSIWRFQIRVFQVRQQGIKWAIGKIMRKIKWITK